MKHTRWILSFASILLVGCGSSTLPTNPYSTGSLSSSEAVSSAVTGISSSATVVSSNTPASSAVVASSSSFSVATSSSSAGLGSLTVSFSLSTHNGAYAPYHIYAVWITTSTGTWVTNLDVRARERYMYLTKWRSYFKQTIGQTLTTSVDGVSGATTSAFPAIQTYTWSPTSKIPIASGDYIVHVEFTDYDGAGPYASQAFSINGSAINTTTNPSSFIKNFTLAYTP